MQPLLKRGQKPMNTGTFRPMPCEPISMRLSGNPLADRQLTRLPALLLYTPLLHTQLLHAHKPPNRSMRSLNTAVTPRVNKASATERSLTV